MAVTNLETGKINGDESLTKFHRINNPPEPKLTGSQQAEMNARLSREWVSGHRPVMNSINNK